VNKQALRNVLRWGGVGAAIIGFILGRTAAHAQTFRAARALVWAGLVMIVLGIFVRLFMPDR